jgi:O-antigen ligase
MQGTERVLDRFPSEVLLLLHAWVSFSAVVAAGRNLWQSASELSLRGLAYNVWLTRGITWHDDYYPLQDPFFYSVALAMLVATWTQLQQHGDLLLRRLIGAILVGAVTNVAFGLWQMATGKGWWGQLPYYMNAFWQDLHSFGVFMAGCLILGYGVLATRPTTPVMKSAAGVAMLASAVGLYLSGSRSTLLLAVVLLIGWVIWVTPKLRGWWRAIPILALIATLGAIHLALDHGYRGISYASLHERLTGMDSQSVNELLSHRPEIWATALHMYLAFPLFGLGQGAFYRLSANPEFSGSAILLKLGGDGVHNEFLRLLVELGPVGFGLVLLAAIPFVRLGRQNFNWVSFYGLVGILLGNLYTNALLVRELLVLCAVFAGSYLWEVESIGGVRLRVPSPGAVKSAAAIFIALFLAALVEVALSFGRFPFTYGQRCLEVHPLSKDGWTQGVLRVQVPPAASSLELIVLADRPDLDRRPLDLDLSVLSGGGTPLETERHTLKQRDSNAKVFQLPVPESPDGKRFVELKPSHCYVPLNMGKTYDPRRLGVRVKELRFRTTAGDEIR